MKPSRPSHTTVVAYLGLFVALGGTAVAVDGSLPGQNTVGSADIINGEVTPDDIKADAIGSAKIAPQSVKNADLGLGASSSNTIADGGIQSIDVKNDTLTGTDVNESTLGTVPHAESAGNTFGATYLLKEEAVARARAESVQSDAAGRSHSVRPTPAAVHENAGHADARQRIGEVQRVVPGNVLFGALGRKLARGDRPSQLSARTISTCACGRRSAGSRGAVAPSLSSEYGYSPARRSGVRSIGSASSISLVKIRSPRL